MQGFCLAPADRKATSRSPRIPGLIAITATDDPRLADYVQLRDAALRRHRLVVLEDIVDHTNVGAILRNAAGLGWQAALLSPRTADPLYRRSIKVSMGAVFSLPWARLAAWSTTPELLTGAGFTTVALTLASSAKDLDEVAAGLRPDQPVAIMLGTEGAGLSQRWSDGATLQARIPMA